VLLQQPLRGTWRPYDIASASAARLRPKARRLELELPLETRGPNYNPDHADPRTAADASKARRGGRGRGRAGGGGDDGDEDEEGGGSGRVGAGGGKPMERMLLRSHAVVEDGGAAWAAGVVRGGRMLLVPVDYALQLRPHLPHLNVPSAEKPGGSGGGGRGKGADSDAEGAGEDEEGGGAVEIEVTVKRRETERQQQARLRSFSHQQQEEEAEEWRRLAVAGANAQRFWKSIAPAATGGAAVGTAAAAPAPLEALPRAAYLEAITPGAAPPPATTVLPPGVNLGTAAAAARAAQQLLAPAPAPATPAAPAGPLGPDAAAAVRRALRELFRMHPVVNLEDVREHLRGHGEPNSTARAGASLGDDALHAVIVGGGEYAALRRVYAQRPPLKDAAAELKSVVIELLAERNQVGAGGQRCLRGWGQGHGGPEAGAGCRADPHCSEDARACFYARVRIWCLFSPRAGRPPLPRLAAPCRRCARATSRQRRAPRASRLWRASTRASCASSAATAAAHGRPRQARTRSSRDCGARRLFGTNVKGHCNPV
jgi:DNA-directed RNA polymerase-3 subunit RPC5